MVWPWTHAVIWYCPFDYPHPCRYVCALLRHVLHWSAQRPSDVRKSWQAGAAAAAAQNDGDDAEPAAICGLLCGLLLFTWDSEPLPYPVTCFEVFVCWKTLLYSKFELSSCHALISPCR
jgi:hypothetical protein